MKSSRITYSDKIFFPVSVISKEDIIGYYEKIADYILLFLKDRPMSLNQFPNRIGKAGLFKKKLKTLTSSLVEHHVST